MKSYTKLNFLILLLLIIGQSNAQDSLRFRINDSLKAIVYDYCKVEIVSRVSLTVNKKSNEITVGCGLGLNEMPFRSDNVKRIYNALDSILLPVYPGSKISCIVDKKPIEFFIPNYFRSQNTDSTRIFKNPKPSKVLVENKSLPYNLKNGLNNRYIALWPSHGSYYDQSQKKWIWQRPVVFRTVEDLLSVSFIVPYLAPMLENAGAQIFLPRERDFNRSEILIDRDKSTQNSKYQSYNDRFQWSKASGGFGNMKNTYLFGENPFDLGSFDFIQSTSDEFESSRVEWLPEIPEDGNYSVYISYKSFPNSAEDAHYEVLSAKGKTEFRVNQTMGGSTWIHLGQFPFKKGKNRDQKIILTNCSQFPDKVITADAVKIGGGMGNISRGPDSLHLDTIPYKNQPVTSSKPRYAEGSRYWLQWAGIPDSVYSRTKNKNDYLDDFQSRGFWVNYLKNKLNIPVDLAFALHTDAGFNTGDTIIGTLGICTVTSTQKKDTFPNGSSRWISRDLTDLIQSQIVEDIKLNFYEDWTRRGIWNKSYSESREPEVPTMLLELLSHQNFGDMQFAHDPKFRFTVARAIYKGMVNYFASQNHENIQIAPLPVKDFLTKFKSGDTILLKWKAQLEPAEPRSNPDKYIVYTAIDNEIFDKGRICSVDSILLKIKPNHIYNFKVCALNDGGISFPSEILSVFKNPFSKEKVLIVNAFDGVNAPDSYSESGKAGFNSDFSQGTPDQYDYHIIGNQIDNDRNSKYNRLENPGFGNTDRKFETSLMPGNQFNYPYIHGKSLKSLGFSFVSASKDAFLHENYLPSEYKIVDLIFGNQHQTKENLNSKSKNELMDKLFQNQLSQYLSNGVKLIVSGANFGSDLYNSENKEFVLSNFHFKGNKSPNDSLENTYWKSSFKNEQYKLAVKFSNGKNFDFYNFRPDILEKASNDTYIFGRYNDNSPCAIFYNGPYKICAIGFPLESIRDEDQRIKVFSLILKSIFKTTNK